MGVARNLLCSSPSFPAKTHLKHSLPPPSSVLMIHEQPSSSVASIPTTSVTRHFPTSVLIQEQREECRPLLHSFSDDKVSQEIVIKSQMDAVAATEEDIDDDLHQLDKIYEWQLLQLPGLWNLLSSTVGKEDSMLSLTMESVVADTKNPSDLESFDSVYFAKKALSVPKEAALLSDDAKVHTCLGSDDMSKLALGEGEVISVRSTRLYERRSKKRRVPKQNLDDNDMSSPRSTRLRRKLSRASYLDDPIRLFLSGRKNTGKLLTVEEESEVIVQVQDLMRLKKVKSKLQSQFGQEPTMVEWAKTVGISCQALQSEIISGNSSRERLINANLRLVVYIAKGYLGHGLSLHDLLLVGSMGLMKSVEKFKPQEGCRFSTYAYWWVRQSIRKALFKHSRAIRLPENVYGIMSKLTEARSSFFEEGNHGPSSEELARRVGIKVERLEKLLSAARLPLSIEEPVWPGQNTTFQEITADSKIETPVVSVEKESTKKHLRNLIRELPPRERKIIRLRYGIEGGKQAALSEIGYMFGISSERVRQLENRALDKLKEGLGEHGFRGCEDLCL